jgi:hypothetical protein
MAVPGARARRSPPGVSNPSDNFKNLFEIPVIFYALALVLFVTGQVDAAYVTAAWVFAAFRALHSAVHCGPLYDQHRDPALLSLPVLHPGGLVHRGSGRVPLPPFLATCLVERARLPSNAPPTRCLRASDDENVIFPSSSPNAIDHRLFGR